MKDILKKIILDAADKAYKNGELPSPEFPDVEIQEPKAEDHGDFATNVAMQMARTQKMAPRKIAETVLSNLDDAEGWIARTEIAGPGFINFFMDTAAWHPVLREIHKKDTQYGAWDFGRGERVQVEFVSANPTGPLHVGHGRGAAVGDSVANILSFCGYDVQREYYVNDSGRQIRTLGRSVFLRYKELFGEEVVFPQECYQGAYIRTLAQSVREQKGTLLLEGKEEEAITACARFAASAILKEIEADLAGFGIGYDRWFSEQTLFDSGKVEAAIREMTDRDFIYENEGAKWFRTSNFGDEKDRVVVKEDGLTTYFASDIAYHGDKMERGFKKVIDVWGADHHGYIARIAASIEAAGFDRDRFSVILVQLVNLLRDGQQVAMSTRSGEFVTLKSVMDEVGRDAARFIFLTRHYESPLDFDLALAKKKTNENPVYYVQYVHARISSIARKAEAERNITAVKGDEQAMGLLKEPEEIDLIKHMARYPETVRASAEMMEPHRITFYLMNLASAFHSYYNKHKVLTEDPDLTNGRLFLVAAVKTIIRNGLTLLGVSAPEKM